MGGLPLSLLGSEANCEEYYSKHSLSQEKTAKAPVNTCETTENQDLPLRLDRLPMPFLSLPLIKHLVPRYFKWVSLDLLTARMIFSFSL